MGLVQCQLNALTVLASLKKSPLSLTLYFGHTRIARQKSTIFVDSILSLHRANLFIFLFNLALFRYALTHENGLRCTDCWRGT